MKYFYNLIFPALLLPLFSIAQSNYKSGYVVTLKSDTIRGFIDYRGWDANPTAISFKSEIKDHDKKTFTINDISLFEVYGLATYKKCTCLISMDRTNTFQLDEGRDTSFKTGAVFLQMLQQGKNVALYSYRDDLKIRFYIGEAPDYIPTELVYRVYYDYSGKFSSRTVNENTYLKQLFALAIKYNTLDDKLSAIFADQFTVYKKSDLQTIVSRINNSSR